MIGSKGHFKRIKGRTKAEKIVENEMIVMTKKKNE